MTRVPRHVYLFLILGLLAVSQSGNIIRLGDAHPVAIAAWRLLLAVIILVPMAGSQLSELKLLSRGDKVLLILTGAVLAAHFFTWIAAVQMTTVANAAIFFAINPVFTAIAAFFIFKERLGLRLLISIGLGVAGVTAIGVGDFHLSPDSLAGDGMALLCAVLFAAYFLLGKRLRSRLDNRVYVSAVYGVAAFCSFICLMALGEPLFRYSGQTWVCFVLMALFPTLIGHTSYNHALRYLPASRIAAATLVEPLLAAVVAMFAWNEAITLSGFCGYGLICLSVGVLALERVSGKLKPA